MLRLLVIGDPHFKDNNAIDTDLMTAKLLALIIELKPDITVLMGDLSDAFNHVTLNTLQRLNSFLAQIQEVSHKMWILIGNHDRRNNNVYMTDEHPFGAMKKWDRTVVADTTTVVSAIDSEGVERKFVLVPYVPPGKFNQALQTKQMGIETLTDKEGLGGVTAVLSHQEFKDAKMGAIKSKSPDIWPLQAPLCINGHVHDYDELQPNLIYVGAPIQLGFKDRGDRTVSLFTFENGYMKEQKRYSLGLPPKIAVRLTPQQLTTYTPPPGAQVRITVYGPISIVNSVMALDTVKALTQMQGIKITTETTSDEHKDIKTLTSEARTNVDFQTRLMESLSKQEQVLRQLFQDMTGISVPDALQTCVNHNGTVLVIS